MTVIRILSCPILFINTIIKIKLMGWAINGGGHAPEGVDGG
jgi:hypothetical protein